MRALCLTTFRYTHNQFRIRFCYFMFVSFAICIKCAKKFLRKEKRILFQGMILQKLSLGSVYCYKTHTSRHIIFKRQYYDAYYISLHSLLASPFTIVVILTQAYKYMTSIQNHTTTTTDPKSTPLFIMNNRCELYFSIAFLGCCLLVDVYRDNGRDRRYSIWKRSIVT